MVKLGMSAQLSFTANPWFLALVLAALGAGMPPALRAEVPAAVGDELIAPGASLRVLTPDLLELELIQTKSPPEPGTTVPWNLTNPGDLKIPEASQFEVKSSGSPVAVREVSVKRRAVYAPLSRRDLRVGTWLYLKLGGEINEGATVTVQNPGGGLWPAGMNFSVRADPLRWSPAIHVNQEGYAPALPKKAMVGYFLGSGGELAVPAARGFRLISPAGRIVHEGRLKRRADSGYVYSPAPYQEVYEADFSGFDTPGEYRLVVPGMGASLPFRIDEGMAVNFARAYALGLYHQRCGGENVLPFTRFVHAACHLAPAGVPSPQADFPFTWKTLAAHAAAAGHHPPPGAPALADEPAQLFPFVRQGAIDVAGGHHDAGDYSKYTINSAALVHCLVFAVDALPGVADLDNLGLPESGDGIPDLLQEAKWEVDFLAKMQDDDGGFHFLVYPRDRAYENNVLPDRGDAQVVWPKNTAATAAGVAALAQAAASPRYREAFPASAADCLARARKGWRFLVGALERHGPTDSYQRLTHYGDNFIHYDELAWAACELFLATGEEEYHRKFREWCDPDSGDTRRWGWWRLTEAWGHAIRSYGFAERTGRVTAGQLDRNLHQKCERAIEAAGRDTLRWAEQSAYGTSFPDATKRMRGGGWYFSLDQAFDLVVASQLDYPGGNDPRARFLEAYVSNLNFEAGTNPVNMTYITGLGQRRPQVVVHQYAENDRRVLPPSGLPIGNIQAGQPYLARYQGELGAMSFPEDGAERAPYPYYDRWSDTYNVSTEFVIGNQAKALAGLAWLAARTKAGRQPWRAASGRITGLPARATLDKPVTVQFDAPAGFDLSRARIVWEARDQQPGWGSPFTFTPRTHGRIWVEAEATWPDGRRIVATAEFDADNGRPVVTASAPEPMASVTERTQGVFRFQRTGDRSAPLTVRFGLRGTATKWNDYRRPEGDMPVQIDIPAGSESVTMSIVPVAAGLGSAARHVMLVLSPDAGYNIGSPHGAIVTLVGAGASSPPPPPQLPALKD